MKKIVIIYLFVLCITQVFGQRGWPPVGAKWHYSYLPCSMGGYGCSEWIKEFIYFEAVKDTILNDTLCTKIIVEYHNDKGAVKYLGDEFIHSTENQVYNYHHGHFYLLYDFSLQVGDTVVLTLGSNCNLYNQLESTDVHFWDSVPVKHFVTEKDSVEINGKKYLYMNMDYNFDWTFIKIWLSFDYRIIIKGIGSLEFLTGNLVTAIESGFYGSLRCYSDSTVNYTTDIPCETLTSSVEGIKKDTKVWVYPNPVTGGSVINFPNTDQTEVTIEITNSAGKTIETTETCENYSIINTEKYSKGIYIYRVYSKDDFIGSGKFIKR
jgi:hypothetical protein